jgi:superfamily II DNA/RNA helicase
MLAEKPDIIVTTPSRALSHLQAQVKKKVYNTNKDKEPLINSLSPL